jgi:hypothetical protein
MGREGMMGYDELIVGGAKFVTDHAVEHDHDRFIRPWSAYQYRSTHLHPVLCPTNTLPIDHDICDNPTRIQVQLFMDAKSSPSHRPFHDLHA